jgi:hypothetical protein
LAISDIGILDILIIRSVTIIDIPIVVVLGIGFTALSFLNKAILI